MSNRLLLQKNDSMVRIGPELIRSHIGFCTTMNGNGIGFKDSPETINSDDVKTLIRVCRDLEKKIDLSGRDLRGLRLSGFNLGGADLSGANLNGAYLRFTRLWGAKIRRANFTDARMGPINWLRVIANDTETF